MRCVEANRLIQAEADRLAGTEERARLREHVAGCVACRQAQRAHRDLIAALAADPDREVRDGFEARLWARLAQTQPRSPVSAWWRRLTFVASWRLAPTLAAGAALAAAAAVWIAAPRPSAGGGPHVAEYVQMHRALVRISREPGSAPEQEVVDYSIAQSAQGSISDTN